MCERGDDKMRSFMREKTNELVFDKTPPSDKIKYCSFVCIKYSSNTYSSNVDAFSNKYRTMQTRGTESKTIIITIIQWSSIPNK